MANIRFKYFYRDGSNFKKWGTVIFSNAEELPVAAVAESLQKQMSPDGYFIASQVNVPEVFLFDDYQLNPDDHCFHEFDSVEVIEDTANDRIGRSIGEFIEEVEQEARRGWDVFDPLEPYAYGLRSAYLRMFPN
jgi:hypothetical protein